MFDNHILAISLQTTFSTVNNQSIVHTILVKPHPWARPIIEREIVGTVFLDLSKAFYLVDQYVLLSKLGKYHMDNTSLLWFKSYLEGWTQRCHIKWFTIWCTNTNSRGTARVNFGCRNLLFAYQQPTTCYSQFQCWHTVLNLADDTTLWETNRDLLHVQQDLQDSLTKAWSRFSLNRIVPNTKKMKQLVIGIGQKLSHSGNPSLNLFLCGTPVGEGWKTFRCQDW